MEYRYKPTGVCSREIILDIENGMVKDLKAVGGCNGNLQGIASLVKGMPVEQVKERLKGIKCGIRNTSCPDQISKALEEYSKGHKLK